MLWQGNPFLIAGGKYHCAVKQREMRRKKRLNEDAETRAAQREYAQRYHQENREKNLARMARYRDENRDAIRAYGRSRYELLKSQGLCTQCGDTAITETFCWKHWLKKKDDYLSRV